MEPVVASDIRTAPDKGGSPSCHRTEMTTIGGLVLAEHGRILRLFRALDDAARRTDSAAASPALRQVWARLADLLELVACTEEEICFPVLFAREAAVTAMLEDALADHTDIREAVEEARLLDVGSPLWWRTMTAARRLTATHFTREEAGLLASVSACLPPESAKILTRQWGAFARAHRA